MDTGVSQRNVNSSIQTVNLIVMHESSTVFLRNLDRATYLRIRGLHR